MKRYFPTCDVLSENTEWPLVLDTTKSIYHSIHQSIYQLGKFNDYSVNILLVSEGGDSPPQKTGIPFEDFVYKMCLKSIMTEAGFTRTDINDE